MPQEVRIIKQIGYRTREDFEAKGLDEDLIDLRFKHFRSRLIDTINSVLQERRNISNYTIRLTLIEAK